MLRCLRPGCPTCCGTRLKPSYADRMLNCAMMFLLTIAPVISLTTGLNALGEAAVDSRHESESTPVAVPKTLELIGKTEDGRREKIWRDRGGKPELLASAPVQISE